MRSYKCIRCSRPLKNPKAIEIGMGPVCAAKNADETKDESQGKFQTFLDHESGNPDIIMHRDYGMVATNVRHVWKNHSPTGFEWGYGGSGPADLALNILIKFGLDREKAARLHQDFKWKFIATMPKEGGIIKHIDIEQWVKQQEV
jgi:hypothetical protein